MVIVTLLYRPITYFRFPVRGDVEHPVLITSSQCESWQDGITFCCSSIYYTHSAQNGNLEVPVLSGYGLDDRAIEVRSPAEAKDFSCTLYVQTGFGVHPASCTMGTGGPFPGAKARPGRDADHSPHLVPGSRMNGSYISSPPQAPSLHVMGQL
jgi:hypothetical protein